VSDESSAPAPRSRRRVLLICLLPAAGVLLVWTGAYAAAGSGVPRDATVLGVSIGGMEREEAQRRLETELAERAGAPIEVRVDKDTYTVDPAAAGMSLDAAATVSSAAGRTWNPAGLWRALTGGGEIAPAVQVDEAQLAGAVSRLCEHADKAPRDADVVFSDAEASVVEPRTGRALDRDAAAAALRSAYLTSEGPVELDAEVLRPEVGAEEADRALAEFGEPALASPVALRVGGTSINVSPAVLAPTLAMEAQGAKLVPTVDGAKLRKALAGKLDDVESRPRDATVRISDGKPVVVPARNGRIVDPEELARSVLAVLPRSFNRLAQLQLTTEPARFTTAEANKLRVKEVVGEFTTEYPYAPYRVTNIGRAAELINGTLLKPGDTFSLNGIVGERTAENGFAAGTIIKNGRFATELGGGVSQVATTTFNAMFFAGLKDVEHKPHSFYISRYPEGREATVAWPVLDLKFQNDSPYGVLVQTVHDEGDSLTVRMWSTKVYDVEARKSGRSRLTYGTTRYDPSPTCVPQGGVPGFDITVTRIFNKGGKEVKREKFFTRYNPADDVICRAEPRDEPEPEDTTPREAAPMATATTAPQRSR
jgi:vancomycin resistance protein YoaR